MKKNLTVILILITVLTQSCKKNKKTKDPIQDIKTGLVGYYPFNGNATDESGNGNHGNVSIDTKLTTDRNGINNKAYIWSGVKSPITIKHSTSQNFTNGVTFSAWVYQTGLYCNNCARTDYISKGRDISPGGIYLGLDHISRKFVFGGGFNPNNENVKSSKGIELLVWTHVVGTYDGYNFKIYINGKIDNTFYYRSNMSLNTDNLLIGSQSGTGMYADNYNMLGKLDDIRIYDRALTAEQISLLFNQP
jgi:hypothetical protein